MDRSYNSDGGVEGNAVMLVRTTNHNPILWTREVGPDSAGRDYCPAEWSDMNEDRPSGPLVEMPTIFEVVIITRVFIMLHYSHRVAAFLLRVDLIPYQFQRIGF